MPTKSVLTGLMILWLAIGRAFALGSDKPPPSGLSTVDVLVWGVCLVFVLGLFLLCAWAIRKFGGITANQAGKMRMVGGLSLGMREKVIMLQVGKKQLILGVTPGRIQTLLVLEGEDCLQKEEPSASASENGFAQKLMQAIKTNPERNPSDLR